MKKKLLVMASTFPRWKNDTIPPFVYELSKRLVDDFDITVLAPSYPGSKKFEVMEGMKVHRFRYFISKFEKLAGSGGILPTLKKNKLYYLTVPFFFWGEYLAAKKLIKKEKFDIIHAHWIIPQGIVAYWINKKFKIPYVVTSHGSDILGLKGFTTLKKNILKNAKRITVVSNAIKKEVLEKIDNSLKIEVIPMGVDTELFNPNKRDESLKKNYNIKGPFLLFVGRLAPEKGITYLIESMPDVIKEYPKAKLLVIGDGTLRKELKELVKKLKIDKSVIFLGQIENKELPKYYATADLFVCPSIREGSPVTYIESLLCGVPIIVGNLLVSRELSNISTGVTIVVDTKTYYEEICSALNKKYDINIKKLSKIYSWDYIKKRYKLTLK